MKRIGRVFGPVSPKATLPVFDIEMSRAEIFQALDYVSDKLSKRGHHITLIANGPALSCLMLKTTQHCSSIPIIPASTLSESEMACLATAVQKAGKNFRLGVDWLNNRDQTKLVRHGFLNTVVEQSLLQNEVLYSAEGLTLLGIDYKFALKTKLEELSTATVSSSSQASMTMLEDCVAILHRLIVSCRGRTITKGFLKKTYPKLEITDAALLRLSSCYEWTYGRRGISGVNDEWMEWRREGRVDILLDLQNWDYQLHISDDDNSTNAGDSRRCSGIENDPGGGNMSEPPPILSPYAINHCFGDMDSEPNSRTCSPRPRSGVDKWGVEQFLQVFNNTTGYPDPEPSDGPHDPF